MSQSTNNTHLLMYPISASSHVVPLLDLALLLLRRGLTITVIISPANLPLLDPLLSSYPSSLHKLVLSDPEITPSPYPLIAKINSTRKLFDPIVEWFQSHPSPPVAIISDFFLGWTNELATKLGIQRVVFSSMGCLGLSIFQELWRNVVQINAENVDGDENFLISLPEIPDSPKFHWWHLPPVSRDFESGEPDFESFRNGILANVTSWGVVYNTFEELEGVYIDYVKKQMGHDRVWAIGPLFPEEHGPIASTGNVVSSAVPRNVILEWLDKKQDKSVVYICFGSRATLSKKQMVALTDALELSKVDFIMCVRGGGSRFIPSGFENQVDGRGFVFNGWAPQMAILRHRAIASFLTHCGWNSVLEGVTTGVTMLMWPMNVEQFANATLMVDQLGVGKLVICEGGPENVPDSVELTRLLDESLSCNHEERVKVKELSQAAMKAVKEGTSIRDLDVFTKLLSELSD